MKRVQEPLLTPDLKNYYLKSKKSILQAKISQVQLLEEINCWYKSLQKNKHTDHENEKLKESIRPILKVYLGSCQTYVIEVLLNTRLANISIVVDLYVPHYCSEFKFTSSNDYLCEQKLFMQKITRNFIIVKLDYSLVKQQYFFIFSSQS